MRLDVYFSMPEGQALPDRDFPGVQGWTGKEYYLKRITFNPKYPVESIINNSSWLSTILEYEGHTLEGNEITFDNPFPDSIKEWDSIENAYPVHEIKREWAYFRAGKYTALIYMLTGIDLFDAACTPEQVKIIAYALNNTSYNSDWAEGIYTLTSEDQFDVDAIFSKRTYGAAMGALRVAIKTPVKLGKVYQSSVFRVAKGEYYALKMMYSFFAEQNASTYSSY